MAAAFALGVAAPVLAAVDKTAERAEYRHNMDKKIQDLQNKIAEVRADHRQDGAKVDQKIKEYEDKIAAIKHDTSEKMKDMNNPNWDKDNKTMGDRLSDVRMNFYEWKFKRSINSYADKIADLKDKAADETNVDKKRELDEKIAKLSAKHDAAQAKLNDLKSTEGDNWEKIEHDLDSALKEIDRDFDAAKAQDTNRY